MPISAADAIGPAFEHMRDQLFRPFRLGQWTRLAIVGILSGETAGSGSCRLPLGNGSTRPSNRFQSSAANDYDTIIQWMSDHLWLVGAIVGALLLLVLLFMFVNSVFRFVLYESVVARHCSIRKGWRRWQTEGWQFFLWQLALMVVGVVGLVAIVAIPAFAVYRLGWTESASAHVPALLLTILTAGLVLFAFIVLVAVARVLANDFVVPFMALEHVGVIDGWRHVRQLVLGAKADTALYLLIKVGLSIVAIIFFFIVLVIVLAVLGLTVGTMGIAAWSATKAMALTWNAVTVTLAVVGGTVALLALIYVIALVATPLAVLFPAYSIYYLADRYPKLRSWLDRHGPPAKAFTT